MNEVQSTLTKKKSLSGGSKGLSLLEVIIAVFIVMIGIGGALGFLQRSASGGATVGNQLVASYLAQEGLEIVRNIRDTNFLEISKGLGANWDDGLTGCSSDCEADYTDIATLQSWNNRFLNINGGLYEYGSGTPTIFKRRITITPDGLNKLDIEVEVFWSERGIARSVTASTELYNWLAPL